MSVHLLLEEVQEKYSEYIEMAGHEGPLLINQILAKMILVERENVEYYKNRLKYATENFPRIAGLVGSKKI